MAHVDLDKMLGTPLTRLYSSFWKFIMRTKAATLQMINKILDVSFRVKGVNSSVRCVNPSRKIR